MTVSYHVTSTLPFAWPTAIKFSGSELGYHATHCYKGINGRHNYSENIYSNKCSNFRFLPVYKQRFKLLRPWRFCQKTRFEASRAVFWSLLCYEELKLTIKPFTGSTLPRLLIQMQTRYYPCRTRHMQNLCSCYLYTMLDYVSAMLCSLLPMY